MSIFVSTSIRSVPYARVVLKPKLKNGVILALK